MSSFGLRWDLSREALHIRLGLSGEIDLLSDGELQQIRQSLAQADVPVLVDLAAVDFMDSTGLRFLVRLAGDLRSDGRQGLVLGPTSPQVQRLLQVAGLGEFFDVQPSSD